MRGRGDARGQQIAAGRGRFGRRQAESPKTNPRLGMIPDIGAYLDLPRGNVSDPQAVLKWLESMRVYIFANFKSSVTDLIGLDGVLGEYPKVPPIEEPPEGASATAMKIWDAEITQSVKDKLLLKEEYKKLYGVLLGQMSEASMERIRNTPGGQKAVMDQDPLELLSYVIATHMNNKRYGDIYNITLADNAFYSNKMLPNESLGSYFSRFRTQLFVRQDAYRTAEQELHEHSDEQLAHRYLVGLNSTYSEYLNLLKNRVIPWPETLADAHADTAHFTLTKPSGTASGGPPASNFERKNVFLAGRGGGREGSAGRSGRGRQSGRGSENPGGGSEGRTLRERDATPYKERGVPGEYGTRYGTCHHCQEEGHYAYECRNGPAGEKTARSPSSKK